MFEVLTFVTADYVCKRYSPKDWGEGEIPIREAENLSRIYAKFEENHEKL